LADVEAAPAFCNRPTWMLAEGDEGWSETIFFGILLCCCSGRIRSRGRSQGRSRSRSRSRSGAATTGLCGVVDLEWNKIKMRSK